MFLGKRVQIICEDDATSSAGSPLEKIIYVSVEIHLRKTGVFPTRVGLWQLVIMATICLVSMVFPDYFPG